MSSEPDLVDQIRAVRRRLWEEHGAAIEPFCEWIRSLEREHPERVVSRRPRTLTDEELAEVARGLER
jgi:hypothetical protein